MSVGPWQLLLVLVIVVLIFGTKKLKNMGSDLGGAVKGFKDGMKDDAEEARQNIANQRTADDANTVDVSVKEKS